MKIALYTVSDFNNARSPENKAIFYVKLCGTKWNCYKFAIREHTKDLARPLRSPRGVARTMRVADPNYDGYAQRGLKQMPILPSPAWAELFADAGVWAQPEKMSQYKALRIQAQKSC